MGGLATSQEVVRKVDSFWAGYFGCRPEDLNAAVTRVVPHAALKGYEGVLSFRHADACIVSVPESVPEIERGKLRNARPDEAFDPRFLSRVFVVRTDKVSGPAWIGIADRSGFQPQGGPVRLLTPADAGAMKRLSEACGEAAWKQSALVIDREVLYGVFEGDELVAASGYIVLGGLLAYIGAVSHPGHRGKGLAKMVMSAAMACAFDRSLFALWRTPEEHAAAVALAKFMGFDHYASTRDVQLLEDEF